MGLAKRPSIVCTRVGRQRLPFLLMTTVQLHSIHSLVLKLLPEHESIHRRGGVKRWLLSPHVPILIAMIAFSCSKDRLGCYPGTLSLFCHLSTSQRRRSRYAWVTHIPIRVSLSTRLWMECSEYHWTFIISKKGQPLPTSSGTQENLNTMPCPRPYPYAANNWPHNVILTQERQYTLS